MPIVSKYKYLGVWFNNSWSWSDHVQFVLCHSERVLKMYEHRFWKNRAVDVEAKVIAWKSIFRPAIEYGSEVWWPMGVDLVKFERLQRKVCKWILGCCVTTTNEIVLGDLGVPSLESRFLRARLAWAGSVKYLGEERIAGLCASVDTSGVRTRTWSQWVSMALVKVGLGDTFGNLRMDGEIEEGKKKKKKTTWWSYGKRKSSRLFLCMSIVSGRIGC